MMEETTLLFRHLPAELSMDERKDFLHHFGAIRCRVFGDSARMANPGCIMYVWDQSLPYFVTDFILVHDANTAFATFRSKEHASEVLHRLHQVEVLGSTLKVEFARDDSKIPSVIDDEGKQAATEKAGSKESKEKEEVNLKAQEIKFDATFNIWGINHPRRPHLKYQYPPPTAVVLTNIMNALASVPNFYVQVLHLMNKMDLPCPFGPLTAAPPLHRDVNGLTQMDDIDQREMEISSETESELESDDEEKLSRSKPEQQIKRLHPKSIRKPRLKKRRLAELQEDVSESVLPSHPTLPVAEVFEQIPDSSSHALKKIELKIPNTVAPTYGKNRDKGKNETRTNAGQVIGQDFGPLPLPAENLAHWPQSQSQTTPIYPKTTHEPRSQSRTTPIYPKATHEPHPPSVLVPYPPSVPLPPLPSSSTILQPAGDSRTHDMTESEHDIWCQERVHSESTAKGLDTSEESVSAGGFGIIKPLPKESGKREDLDESAQRQWGRTKFITSSELRKGRLSQSEMRELNVYKRYEPGESSCRLYIKNVAKQANEEDLHWLYGRYVDWDSESEQIIFDICLMKAGRMKGQAFVTLPSGDVATDALRDTNGFLLKDKPLVVQFARSAKAQEDGSSGAAKSR